MNSQAVLTLSFIVYCVGIGVTLVWQNMPMLKGALYELVPAFVLAFLTVWLVSLAIKPTSEKVSYR